MSYATVATLINRACIELGLISSPVVNPLTATDPNLVLMRYLLNSLGERLVRDYQWRHLKKTGTFTTVSGQEQYALAGDFHRMVENTQWNRGTDLPLTPLTSQGWQFVKAIDIAAAPEFFFRLVGSREPSIELNPLPGSGQTISYEYISLHWLIEPGETQPTNLEINSPDDLAAFDIPVMVSGLKLAFREARGLDTAAYQNAFDKALNVALGNDTAAPTLSLDRATRIGPPLPTLPWTNWGQT